ncbi:MAG: C25 family cysteine peptidase [Phycisphaerae bacterium]|nr:C25 family cysteine peptidase [Phycisphaerae bacterium]
MAELGPPINLSGLAVEKQAGSTTLAAGDVNTQSLTFQIDEQDCFIYYRTVEGYDYIALGKLWPEANPGQPWLPMKTFRVELDRETEILGLEVVEGTFHEIKTELNLLPAAQVGDLRNAQKVIADEKIYSSDALFPGRLVGIEHGADNQRQYVFARLFPVQYAPAKKKAMLLTQATLKLYYRLKSPAGVSEQATTSKRTQRDQAGGLATEAQCVVLCPATLRQQAERLSRFHTTQEGITSTVVTTEAIGQAYTPAEDPPFEGYQNAQLGGWDRIRHYDYALAKKIVAYLRDQPAHPRLVYVTIVGDGLLVPPSFYYYWRRYDAVNGPPYRFPPDHRIHDKWVPTDLFYASPDYDWVPNYRIGRLSVNDANEAAQVVDKVIRWHENADWSWFRNVQLGGTERSRAATIIQESWGLFEGMNLKTCCPDDDRSDRVFLEPALTIRDTGIFWCTCHGSISGLSFTGSRLGTDELLHYAPHIKVPIFISISCYGGAFDLDLMECSYSLCSGTHSFGEAVLKSPAAGIAYFGCSRGGLGSRSPPRPRQRLARGKQCYVGALLYGIMQSRRQGADTLGQLYADSLFEFVSNVDMAGNPCNVFSAFEFVLLGDPALKIPVRP